MAATKEVETFLSDMGLESCVQAVVHNGFYTSSRNMQPQACLARCHPMPCVSLILTRLCTCVLTVEALRGATYEELVDSGVRPVHAKLILSSLGTKGGQGPLPGGLAPSQGADEVLHFLRSIGLENCASELNEAGYNSLDQLSDASLQNLLDAGLKPVHARLIASNLDTASTAGIAMTPAAQRLASIDAEDTLLGAPRKRKPRRVRLLCCAVLALLAVGFIIHAVRGGSGGVNGMALTGQDGTAASAGTLEDGATSDAGEGKHKHDGKHKGSGGGGANPHGAKGMKPSKPMK